MATEPVKRTPLTAIGAATFHPKRQNVSFGRWAMPVMAEKLQESDPVDRRRALQSLCDYVFDSRRVVSKEFSSVVPHLKGLIHDEDDEVRLKVAECFAAIAASAAGRQSFDKHDFHKETLELLEDKEEIVRKEANIVVQLVSLSPIGAESIVKAGAIEKLIKRIPQESDAVLEVLLQGLHSCCLVDPEGALAVDGLEALVPLLGRPCPRVREKAAKVIKDLTVEADGRYQALELSALPTLLDMCLEEDDLVKAKALAAIMMIINTTKGKFTALENDGIGKVFPLLKSENMEVRINAIKVLTALSEAPEGRLKMLESFREVVRLLNDDFQEIRTAAKRLITVMEFKP